MKQEEPKAKKNRIYISPSDALNKKVEEKAKRTGMEKSQIALGWMDIGSKFDEAPITIAVTVEK